MERCFSLKKIWIRNISISLLSLICLFLGGCGEKSAERSTVSVQFLSVNDFHGQLDRVNKVNGKSVGSASYLAAHLRKREQQNKHTFLVHAGDAVGASAPISSLLQDEPTIDILNTLQFDVGTLGNHEFDEGVEEMMRLIDGGVHPTTGYFAGANFPYTVANVVDKKTKKPILPPYIIEKVEGIPIAFIGVVTHTTPMSVMPNGIQDVIFTDEAEAINREVANLKQQGVKAILVLAHEGGTQNGKTGEITGPIADITQKLDEEVDVVFSGHSHTYLNGTIDHKLVVQASCYGAAFASVEVVLDRNTKDVIHKQAEIVNTFHDDITPDAQIQKIVDRAAEKVAPITSEEIAQAKKAITRRENKAGESALGNLIADSQRWAMKTDFAFMNPGGIRADLPAGKVTWGDLYTIQPFQNDLMKMELTGEQIGRLLQQQFQNPSKRQILKVAGLTFSWSNDRVIEIKQSDGTPLVPTQTYTVAVNRFLAEGGDNFTVFTEGKKGVVGSIDLDAFIGYIRQLPQPFSAQIEGRIQRVDR
jgi:5'-nucleotidase